MTDLIVGLGLVLVIEGLLWAAFPSAGRQLLEMAAKAPVAKAIERMTAVARRRNMMKLL